ncbi:uncharacterized protein BDV17DRAFT_105539 [Aspergillus undulatus]|uniref:uncharacterized protein n=1 Tax=Aspergillus undulatus TaxID=1810928 RepID=UPI003CCD9420
MSIRMACESSACRPAGGSVFRGPTAPSRKYRSRCEIHLSSSSCSGSSFLTQRVGPSLKLTLGSGRFLHLTSVTTNTIVARPRATNKLGLVGLLDSGFCKPVSRCSRSRPGGSLMARNSHPQGSEPRMRTSFSGCDRQTGWCYGLPLIDSSPVICVNFSLEQ